jgi:hypothetical protein
MFSTCYNASNNYKRHPKEIVASWCTRVPRKTVILKKTDSLSGACVPRETSKKSITILQFMIQIR